MRPGRRGGTLVLRAALLLVLFLGSMGSARGQEEIGTYSIPSDSLATRADLDGFRVRPHRSPARQSFVYPGGPGRDPFWGAGAGGAPMPGLARDFRLSGILHAPAGAGVAVLRDQGSGRLHRLRLGDRLHENRLSSLGPREATFRTPGTGGTGTLVLRLGSEPGEADQPWYGWPPVKRPGSGEAHGRITVTYDSASILDVLAGFAAFTGLSIVPGGSVASRTVRGVSITDQPWEEALEAVLSAHGLGWRSPAPGILIVDELEALAHHDTLVTETRIIQVNYASADSMATMLADLATPERGRVVAYGEANSVVVTDRPAVVSRMDSLVRSLDRRTPQVSIEARIVFVDRTNVNALGISYDLQDRSTGSGFTELLPPEDVDGSAEQEDDSPDGGGVRLPPYTVRLGGPTLASIANANERVAGPSLRILASTVLGGFSLTAFLDALRTRQLSEVVASPSIQVMDNHPAYVQVGERTPIRILESGAQLEQDRVSVQFEDTGIILRVTPHITNNGQILLDLETERSGLQVGLSDVGFNFTRQVGRTRLLLGDGETGAIAGLTLTEANRIESGIPLLMDLPLLGRLFRTARTSSRKQDLVILVTPRIVEPHPVASVAEPVI